MGWELPTTVEVAGQRFAIRSDFRAVLDALEAGCHVFCEKPPAISPEEAGQMEMGVAGTENYGTVNAYNVENSNVDMATEMVNMIITQRGFQSNSKVVTTADQMLQKAMELKR